MTKYYAKTWFSEIFHYFEIYIIYIHKLSVDSLHISLDITINYALLRKPWHIIYLKGIGLILMLLKFLKVVEYNLS